jgi:hypothetical protein
MTTTTRFTIAGLMSACALSVRGQSPPTGMSVDKLRTAVSAFAHDSLGGRISGTSGAAAVANAIAKELGGLHLKPAGDKGKWLQDVPLVRVGIDSAATQLSIVRATFTYGIDYQPLIGVAGLPFPRIAGANEWVDGGRLGAPDHIDSSLALGKAVLMRPPLRANGQPDYQVWNYLDQLAAYAKSSAILLESLELMPASVRRAMNRSFLDFRKREPQGKLPPVIAISSAVASYIRANGPVLVAMGARGLGRPEPNYIHVRVGTTESSPRSSTQNVVAILEGSDPRLASEYVVVTARLDQTTVDDGESEMGRAWPLDRDSIYNGANAVSGAVALLEMARSMDAMTGRPKRSIVFLWTVATDDEARGVQWFLEHSQIPRDKIVAHLDVDRIGRGGALDISDGGPNYLQIAGSRRLSSQFGAWIDEVNQAEGHRFSIDYTLDGAGDSARYHCGAVHRQFARYTIPSVFITTGTDADTRTVDDETGKIDFVKLGRLTDFVGALALDVANRPSRPQIDTSKPDPKTPWVPCLQ